MTTVYAAMNDSLLIVRQRGDAWLVERHLEDRQTQCLAVDPLRPEVLFCGTFGQGLWRSADAGASWQAVGEGIAHGEIMAVAVSPSDRRGNTGVVYAGTEPSALFRSDNGRTTWQECFALQELPSKATWSYPPRPWTHHVRCIGLDPRELGLVIVCLENGALVRSLDGGATFIDRTLDSPMDTHTLFLHPRAPGRVYAAAGDGFARPGSGYLESRDSGASWQRPDDGIAWHYGWGLAVDAGDPDTAIIAMAQSPDKAHNPARAESIIYRRSGVSDWQEVGAGLPDRSGMLASQLAAHPDEPHVFFALNNLGLFRSADAGETWQTLPIPWPSKYRWSHPQAMVITE